MDSLELERLSIPEGGNPHDEEWTWQEFGFIFEGDLLTFVAGAKRPKFGRHSKYLKNA